MTNHCMLGMELHHMLLRKLRYHHHTPHKHRIWSHAQQMMVLTVMVRVMVIVVMVMVKVMVMTIVVVVVQCNADGYGDSSDGDGIICSTTRYCKPAGTPSHPVQVLLVPPHTPQTSYVLSSRPNFNHF